MSTSKSSKTPPRSPRPSTPHPSPRHGPRSPKNPPNVSPESDAPLTGAPVAPLTPLKGMIAPADTPRSILRSGSFDKDVVANGAAKLKEFVLSPLFQGKSPRPSKGVLVREDTPDAVYFDIQAPPQKVGGNAVYFDIQAGWEERWEEMFTQDYRVTAGKMSRAMLTCARRGGPFVY